MKKRSKVFVLNKTKIVNLSNIQKIVGGTDLESNVNNPDETCGSLNTEPPSDMTDDRTNTDNYIPSDSCLMYC
ncbi:hypothetical protein [Kordia sp.]|uniref:hypothetical protein n=1 Tax=Kordia sp. TaxID=1965332 RepID=UPI003D2BC633